jgi:hypothetical protein
MNQQKAEEKTTLNQDDMLEVDHFLRFIQLRTKRTITLVVHTVIHSLAVF